MNDLPCLYPNCCCAGECVELGGKVPHGAPAAFTREQLLAIAGRHDLAVKLNSDAEFSLTPDDMRAIVFALRLAARRIS